MLVIYKPMIDITRMYLNYNFSQFIQFRDTEKLAD